MHHRSDTSDPQRPRAPDRAPSLGLRERVGDLIGRLWAPGVALISRLRRARMFHPAGHTFTGKIDSILGGNFDALGGRLDGRALVRVSGALWKSERERFEVLGIGLRLHRGDGESSESAKPGDQDLLFATIRSPFTMALSPFTTDASNFLSMYWAVSPFEAPPVGRIKLRLRPIGGGDIGGSRIERLREAVRRGEAAWRLEARETLTWRWHPVAVIQLEREVMLDQAALSFDPFRTGADVTPVGLVHAIRRAVYAASQRARHAVGS